MSNIVQPFEPERKDYRVYYPELDEHGRHRYVLGRIEFPEAGGVMVTRRVDGRRVFVPHYTKIEEELDDHV
jgi:hypothetical protein